MEYFQLEISFIDKRQDLIYESTQGEFVSSYI